MAKEPDKPKPGPEAERLTIDNPDWEDAMGKALEKKRPPEGWPDHKDEPDEEEAPE